MNSITAPLARIGRNLGPSLLGIVAAVAIAATLTGLLYARVALSEDPSPRTPLTVATVTYEVQDSYQRTISYLGLVTAGRKANLGFEIPGTLDSPPLRQGSPVRQGELIATLDKSALLARRDATAAELEQTRVELELARLKANRQRELRSTGAVSKEAFDETRLRARALVSQVDAVTARLASIDIELRKSDLLAPYDGIIADRYLHQGAVVNPGIPVVRLIETAAQEAHIGVAATRTEELSIGSSYPLRLREATFEAELLSIRPDVDPLTRATTSVFAIPADIQALDGETVTLELGEPVRETGGWLPVSALLEGRRGVWMVLRIESDGERTTAVREAVEVVELRGDQAFVRGTLPPGSSVIASGVHRISPGSQVTPAEN